jgi:HEAT repeat protein
MKKWLWPVVGVVVVVAIAVVLYEPTAVVRGWLFGESFFQGRPTRYWAQALRDGDPAAQAQASRALKEGGAAALPILVEIVGDTTSPEWSSLQVRVQAAEMLGAHGPAGKDVAGPALVAALRDRNPEMRAVAAVSLEKVGYVSPEAVPPLIAMLKQSSDERVRAARGLAVQGAAAKAAVAPLTALLGDPEAEVRWNAAWALGKIGPEARAAVPALVARLKDDAAPVREHAAEALGDIGPDARAAVPDLVLALKDADARVRRDAVRSLGQIGPAASSAAPAIRELLKDESERVRTAAGTALKQVGEN